MPKKKAEPLTTEELAWGPIAERHHEAKVKYRCKRAAPAHAVLDWQVGKLKDYQEQVIDLEGQLKKAKQMVQRYEEHILPDTMEDMGLTLAGVTGGHLIELKESINAAPLAANRDQCWDWLKKNKHGGLIKHTVMVPFAADEDKKALAYQKRLKRDSSFERKVEASTLSAWAREQISSGGIFPMGLFGVFPKRVVKVKASKQ